MNNIPEGEGSHTLDRLHSQPSTKTRDAHTDGQPRTFYQALREAKQGVSFLSVVLAVAAVVQAWVSFVQWQALLDANRTAQDSAEAAKRSAEIANQTLRISQRPYLLVQLPSKIYGADLSSSPYVEIVNEGLSLAKNLEILIRTSSQTPKTEYETFGVTRDLNTFRSVKQQGLEPKAKMHAAVSSTPIPAGTSPKYFQGNFGDVYLYGILTYEDLFNQKHKKLFCGRFLAGNAAEAEKASSCAAFNYTD